MRAAAGRCASPWSRGAGLPSQVGWGPRPARAARGGGKGRPGEGSRQEAAAA